MPSAAIQAPQEHLARFGLTAFRPGQREVIAAVLDGRDVLCVMPTGGGKSLCYQLPALCLPGITIVVSPLIALMKDQEDQLRRLGIAAAALHSGIDLPEQRERLAAVARGDVRILYVAPERLRSPRFLELAKRSRISLLAVDEAHCISEWGHDFRPDYARLGWLRQQLGSPPTIALTATATDVVRRDIAVQLRLSDPAVFIRGFDRPNLFYGVTMTSGRHQKHRRIAEILSESPGPAIIYTSKRKDCEEVAGFLRGTCQRRVSVYHAGLPAMQRREAQDSFMAGGTDVIVATNAFGMGVDKADVRAVVHHSLPGTLEAYYQEAGRAGRDGNPARCELLFSFADRYVQEYFIDNEYPEPPLVASVLELLRGWDEELIQLTRAEIKERLGGSASEMAIGSCLKLLEGAGAIERLGARENHAILRLHENGPDLADLLPASATTQRKVLRHVEELVGSRRGEDVYFLPDRSASELGVERSTLVQALRDLSGRMAIEYIPPFRGSATRVLDRLTPFAALPIDFEQLFHRKDAERDKLARVMGYAQSPECRRQTILDYFGERCAPCGRCDNCARRGGRHPSAASGASPDTPAVSPLPEEAHELLRQVVFAAEELRGRFGKTTVAQVLAGSTSEKLQRFGLQRRKCFGCFSGRRQTDLVALLDALLLAGVLDATGDRLRPTVSVSEMGSSILRGERPWPEHLPVPGDLWGRLGVRSRPPEPPRLVAPQPTAAARPAGRPRPAPDEVEWTLRVLEKGFSVAECAEIRRLGAAEILEHALAAAQSGRRFPSAPFKAFPFDPALDAALARLLELLDE